MIGKEIRLKRLYKHSDRLFVVPMDHGLTIGPVTGLDKIGHTVNSIAKGGGDAVIIHKGMAGEINRFLDPSSCELIMHLSASTSLAPDPNRKELVTSVEKAIELGATAVSIHVNLGSAFEAEMLKDFGMVAECSNRWGMPLLAMMYIRDGCKENEFNPEKIRHAARVAEEMGADIIKVNYTGEPETFAAVTEGVSAPVIIAGGPRMDSHYELLAMVSDAVLAGAKGVAIGRNVFQDPHPMQLTRMIRQILDNAVPKEKISEFLQNLGW